MGRKKIRKRKKGEKSQSEPVADEPLTDVESEAIVYLANQYISEIEAERLEPWKQTYRFEPVSLEVKQTAMDLEKNLIEASKRRPGRPAKAERPSKYIPNSLEVVGAVRDFLASHPGAMVKSGERYRYTDEFKLFAVSLLEEGGLAEHMTAEYAASLIGVPYNTFAQWRSKAPASAGKPEGQDEH